MGFCGVMNRSGGSCTLGMVLIMIWGINSLAFLVGLDVMKSGIDTAAHGSFRNRRTSKSTYSETKHTNLEGRGNEGRERTSISHSITKESQERTAS
jgi:hypothetical protein